VENKNNGKKEESGERRKDQHEEQEEDEPRVAGSCRRALPTTRKPKGQLLLTGCAGKGAGAEAARTTGGAVMRDADHPPHAPEACYRVCFTRELHKKRRSYVPGVMCVREGKARLFDEEGKPLRLGKTLWVKEHLASGAELQMYPNLIEVESEMDVDDFVSGRAFAQTFVPAVTAAARPLAEQARGDRFQPLLGSGSGLKRRRVGPCVQRAAVPQGALVVDDGLETDSGAVYLEHAIAQRLRPHQEEGVRFMYGHLKAGGGCILADSMGLGKTLQALCLIWLTLSRPAGQPMCRKAAVVCPSSLCENWEAEARKWLGCLRLVPTLVQGGRSPLESVRALRGFLAAGGPADPRGRLLVISYEQLRLHADLVDGALDLLVCDEGHRLKSICSTTTQRLSALRCRRRVLLTGTPLQNNLDEFWCCCTFVQPQLLPPLAAFQRVFKRPIERAQDVSASAEEVACGGARSAELARLAGSIILRRGPEILETLLPERTELLVTVPLTSLQARVYRALCQLRSLPGAAGQALSLLLVLRQLCNDPEDFRRRYCRPRAQPLPHAHLQLASSLEEAEAAGTQELIPEGFDDLCRQVLGRLPQGAWEAAGETSAKFHALSALLTWVRAEVPEDGVVIVSNFISALARCREICAGLGFSTTVLDGKTDVRKRHGLVSDFNQRKGCKAFVLSVKAGGVGLNLVGANRLVMFEPDWNPAVDLQAMGRVWRQGQTKPVFIYRLATFGTLEEKILLRQTRKQGLATVMESGVGAQAGDWDELRRVFELEGYAPGGEPLAPAAQGLDSWEGPCGSGTEDPVVRAALHSVRRLGAKPRAAAPEAADHADVPAAEAAEVAPALAWQERAAAEAWPPSPVRDVAAAAGLAPAGGAPTAEPQNWFSSNARSSPHGSAPPPAAALALPLPFAAGFALALGARPERAAAPEATDPADAPTREAAEAAEAVETEASDDEPLAALAPALAREGRASAEARPPSPALAHVAGEAATRGLAAGRQACEALLEQALLEPPRSQAQRRDGRSGSPEGEPPCKVPRSAFTWSAFAGASVLDP